MEIIFSLITITGSHKAHPNFFQFIELVKKELLVSADEITMAEQGNWNNKPMKPKNLMIKRRREKMMTEVQKRQRSLFSFQQAIGGSLAKSVHMADNDFDPDNDPLTVSKSSSIRVPFTIQHSATIV